MSRFYDLYGLNREFIPENEYTATETNLFSTGNYIPLSILSYIKKYITLPFEELARYGFSQNAGAPNYRNDRSMKRLRDRVKQFIDFVFYHEWKHHHQNISNVRDYLIAIIYPCIINEMIAHCEKENNAQRRAFFIKETIRMFHPPHSHFDSEAFYLDGKLVYDAIDKDIDLIIQMSESERKEWLSTILATPRIPLSDTSQWKRLLAMGSEIYGTHDVLGEMQDEYETEFETRDTGGGPLTVYGTTKSSIPVTIYGEEHVLTSNTFYRSNHFTKRTDYTVWVEHDALQCSVTEQDKHMFYKSKGLEWVWYRRVTLGLPVECIDIRIKIGLPQPWKEDALRFVVGIPTLYNKPEAYEIQHQYIQQYRLNEPTGFLAYVENMMTIYRTAVAEIMNVSLSDSYRYYMTALEEQIATITSIVTKDKPLVSILVVDKDAEDYEDRVEPTRIDSTIFHEEQKNIIRNMLRFHSLVVDAHVMNLLDTYRDDKPIFLFVGINHAFQLAKLLQWNIDERTTTNDFGSYDSLAEKTLFTPFRLHPSEYTITGTNHTDMDHMKKGAKSKKTKSKKAKSKKAKKTKKINRNKYTVL